MTELPAVTFLAAGFIQYIKYLIHVPPSSVAL